MHTSSSSHSSTKCITSSLTTILPLTKATTSKDIITRIITTATTSKCPTSITSSPITTILTCHSSSITIPLRRRRHSITHSSLRHLSLNPSNRWRRRPKFLVLRQPRAIIIRLRLRRFLSIKKFLLNRIFSNSSNQ